MLRRERVAFVLRRELRSVIKKHLQRSEMRLQKHIRRNHFVLQLWMFSFVSGVLMRAHVIPRPAVEAALLHMRDVVRNKVVTQRIAFVGGAPELARRGMDRLSNAIANAIRIHLYKLSFRREFQ